MTNSAVTKIPTFLCSKSTMEAHYFDVSIDNFERVNADLVINTSIRKWKFTSTIKAYDQIFKRV